METIIKDKKEQIIDMVCSIPVDQWDNKSTDNSFQTLFKGKVIRLSASYPPEQAPIGLKVAKLIIDGVYINDSGGKCIGMFTKISEHIKSQEQKRCLGELEDIYNALKQTNENN